MREQKWWFFLFSANSKLSYVDSFFRMTIAITITFEKMWWDYAPCAPLLCPRRCIGRHQQSSIDAATLCITCHIERGSHYICGRRSRPHSPSLKTKLTFKSHNFPTKPHLPVPYNGCAREYSQNNSQNCKSVKLQLVLRITVGLQLRRPSEVAGRLTLNCRSSWRFARKELTTGRGAVERIWRLTHLLDSCFLHSGI